MYYEITDASEMRKVAQEIMKGEHPTYIIKGSKNYYVLNFDVLANSPTTNNVFWAVTKSNAEQPNPYYKAQEEEVVVEDVVVEPVVAPTTYARVETNREVEVIRLTNELRYAKVDLERAEAEKEDYLTRLDKALSEKTSLQNQLTDSQQKVVELTQGLKEATAKVSELEQTIKENSVFANKTLGELIDDIKEYILKQTM